METPKLKSPSEMEKILVYFATKYGNWDDIYAALRTKEKVEAIALIETLDNLKSKNITFITLIGDNYPLEYRSDSYYKPPFVVFNRNGIESLDTIKPFEIN